LRKRKRTSFEYVWFIVWTSGEPRPQKGHSKSDHSTMVTLAFLGPKDGALGGNCAFLYATGGSGAGPCGAEGWAPEGCCGAAICAVRKRIGEVKSESGGGPTPVKK